MQQTLRCWAEVDLDALRENLEWIRFLAGRRRVITVVKADAYGHGLRHIARLLMQSGTDMFGVANLQEAKAIRSLGGGWPVLLLGACLPQEVASAVRDQVQLTVSSLEDAQRISAEALRQKTAAKVQVKVDTGMGRLGIEAGRAFELIQAARTMPGLKLEGVFTHFASAEDDGRFTTLQQRRFEQVVISAGLDVGWIHSCNSAGLLFQKDTVGTAVRPGLLVYGIVPSARRNPRKTHPLRLRPALSWKCRVGLVKEVGTGATLSYGRTFKVRKSMRVGVVTAGYGDGYMRAAGGKAGVLVGGHLCKVLGRVTMDQMIVDLSGVPEAKAGDEAVLIGRQGRGEISATQLADWCGTIPWEVLTNITYRVPRIYLGGQAS